MNEPGSTSVGDLPGEPLPPAPAPPPAAGEQVLRHIADPALVAAAEKQARAVEMLDDFEARPYPVATLARDFWIAALQSPVLLSNDQRRAAVEYAVKEYGELVAGK